VLSRERNLIPPGLILITDRSQAVRPLLEICEAALDAGFVGVMVREKDLSGGPLHDLALPIAELCADRGRLCLINDRLDVALALSGAGAHVGKQGMPVMDARRLLGPDRLLGYSAHEPGEAGLALEAGADYVTLSPIFPSRSKSELTPRGPRWLAEGVSGLPPNRIVALGGIVASNTGEIRRAGARGAAVMGEVMRSENPRRTAVELIDAWG
jgi:thiamine-phosphate pyrophosphorylase